MIGGRLAARALTGAAFLHTRALQRRLRSRADVEAWRATRLRRFMHATAPAVAAGRGFKDRPLADCPVMDKAALMSAFARYNRVGVTAEAAWAALAQGRPVHGLHVGASTGTSGNRGLYLVSDAERYRWLGVILAKALPDVLARRHRVAVALPTNSRLYDAAAETGRLSLSFFDLRDGLDRIAPQIAAWRPTCIVAPPKVLVALAELDRPLAPDRLFSAAEVLDPGDRAAIQARFGPVLGQIYMATEGLFGVSCAQGVLHLAEDVAAFEWEPAPCGLASPIVTDFTRREQVMARYRMNDLLRLAERPCTCGSPLQAVAEIVGRADDVFELAAAHGGRVRVTPDVIRNAVLDADRRIADFRVLQTCASTVVVRLAPGPADRLDAARQALAALFARLGASVEVAGAVEPLSAPTDRKLRRVMRMPGAAP